MRVGDLMRTEVWQAFPEESLADASKRMRNNGVGSLPVTDGDKLVGMLTERDLMWAMADGAPPNVTKVGTYMSGSLVVATPELDVQAAARLMVRHDIRHLPVVSHGMVVGMISARDLLVVEAWPAAQATNV